MSESNDLHICHCLSKSLFEAALEYPSRVYGIFIEHRMNAAQPVWVSQHQKQREEKDVLQ